MNNAARHPHLLAALRIVVSACLATLLLLAVPVQAQQPEPPDLPGYTALVREAAAAARRNDRLGLEDAGARLAAVTVVRVGDETLPADNRWLAAELARPAPRNALIATRLTALADALSLPPGAAPPDALERLRAILVRPPFADATPQTPQWWTDFWNWVGRVLEALLRPLTNVQPAAGSGTTLVVAALGILLLVGIGLYLFLGLRRSLVRSAQAAPAADEETLTAREAIDQAGELIRSGDHRAAVRYLHLAALLWLDERGALRYDRALTNREHLERLRDNPELRGRLVPIIATFDRVWYGHAPITPAELDTYRAQVEALRREGAQ